jgi:flagellin
VSNTMVDRTTNLVATSTIQLKNIAQFYDNNGRFIVDNPQNVTLVQGNGTRTSFTIYDNDTLSGICAKFGNAICATGGLNQNVMWGNSGDFCTLTTSTINTGSAENASGSFVLKSAIAGDDGTLTIIADQSVINAFGFSDFRASNQTSYTVTITNANTGAQLLSTNLKGNAALGLVYNNVDVKFDSKAGLTATYTATGGLFIVSGATIATANTTIHLVDNSQTFQIGANEKQNMSSAIGNMRSDALGVDNILLSNITVAGMAITKIDMAYGTVSSQRSYLGAIQNRLETTMSNLQVGAENIQSAESRIRDADMATEMMEFTRLNILTQASTAMLAQANTLPQQALQLLGR